MSRKCTENTLVIGNGFSRSVFDGIPSWGNLFEEEKSTINNYTILYETYLVQNELEEENVKKGIVDGFRELFVKENIKKDLYCVHHFTTFS